MARKKTLREKIAGLIAEYGPDAVIQEMMAAETYCRPRQPRKSKATTRKEQEGLTTRTSTDELFSEEMVTNKAAE